jgi:putative ABC transport system permease protein
MLHEDLRHAWRALRARPAFALTVVLLMALTIGANTAIFSLIDSVLLSSLPYRDSSRLVLVTGTRADSQTEPFSIADFLDIRDRSRAFEALVPAFQWSANLTGGEAERLQGMKTPAAFFAMLGVSMAQGRPFTDEDERNGRRVAIIGHGLWIRRFGAAPGIVGSDITLNGENYTVVGVLPRSFVPPIRDAEVIAPFVPATDPRRDVRDARFLRVIGRLTRGVTVAQAQADVSPIVARLQKTYPSTNGTIASARVEEWHRTLVSRARPALLMLQGVAAFVLLVACANLANLFLVSAVRREREFAVRAALGGSRRRLARQVLIESAMMAFAGAAAGLILELWVRRSVLALAPTDWLVAASDVSIDWRLLTFTVVATSLAALAFGSLPAWRVASADPGTLLQGASRDDAGAVGRGVRRTLVAIEVALATALVLATVLLSDSFARLQSVDPGFRGDHLLTVRLSLPRGRYAHRDDVKQFIEALRPRLLALPGVVDAAAVNVVPLNNYFATADLWRADRPAPPPDQVPEAHYRMITASYFQTFGVPVLSGRVFDEHDTEASPSVVLVGRRLAQRLWAGESPLGRDVVLSDSPVTRRATVVGVVGNVKHFGLEAEPTADVYVPIRQVPEFTIQWLTNNMYWGLRTTVDPATLRDAVRKAVHVVDRDVPASAIRPMDEVLAVAIAPRRLNLWLVRVFATAALLLAAAGVYAVTAFGVASRRRELAIRSALGAGHQRNIRAVLDEVLRPIVVGLAAGAIILGLSMPALRSMVFGVETIEPMMFASVAAAMLGVSLLAATLGAVRLRAIDPLVALRE